MTRRSNRWLSAPLPGLPGQTRETALWSLLALFVFVTRLLSLGERGMSHDESIHASLSFTLFDKGTYAHSPAYHGPLLYHLNALVYLLFGDTDATARLVPALTGVALVFGALLLRRFLGPSAALSIATLVAISPTLLFYSRYIRNDVYIALLSLLTTYYVFRYLEHRHRRFLYGLTVTMGLAFATKENSFIFGASLGSYLCLLALLRRREGQRLRGENGAADLAMLLLTLVLPFASATWYLVAGWPLGSYADAGNLARNLYLTFGFFAASGVLAFLWFGRRSADAVLDFPTWLRLAGLLWAINLLLYTSFLTDFPRGLTSGTVGSLGYWLNQHPVARGSQPIYYYGILAALYESLPVLLSLFGSVAVLRRSGTKTPLLAFLVWWTWSSWILYSVAGERMPWLLVHIALPSCLLGGWWLSLLLQRIPLHAVRAERALRLLLALPLLVIVAVGLMRTFPETGRDVGAISAMMSWLARLAIGAAVLVLSWRAVRRVGGPTGRRLLGIGLLAALALFTLRASLTLSFRNGDMATELLVYAHGTPDLARALGEIELIRQRTAGEQPATLAVDHDIAWPFVWYFRNHPDTRFYGESPNLETMKSTVILVGPDRREMVRPYLVEDYDRRTYLMSWWPVEGYKNLTLRGLLAFVREPDKRNALWEIVVHRRYPGTTLAEWPLRKEFQMYVRRDLAARIWDLGVLPVVGDPARVELRGVKIVASHEASLGGEPLKAPRDVAIGPAGERVIADTGNHRVVVLDESGAFRTAFGSRCSLRSGEQCAADQFDEPWGIAVSEAGTIFVADTWNGRIQLFDLEGRPQGSWGAKDGMFGPRDLTFSEDGNLLVADTGNKRILEFDPQGNLVRTIGKPGVGPVEFDEPVGLALDERDGAIWVADSWNARVQKLSVDYEQAAEAKVRAWRSRAPGDKPYLVAWADRLYATDPGSSRVLVLDDAGELLEVWAGELAGPSGIAVDRDRERLLVADAANDRIVELALSPEP